MKNSGANSNPLKIKWRIFKESRSRSQRQKTPTAGGENAPLRTKEINELKPVAGTPAATKDRRTAIRIRIRPGPEVSRRPAPEVSRQPAPGVELASRTTKDEAEPQIATAIQETTGETEQTTTRGDHPTGEGRAREPIRAIRARSREESRKRIWLQR